MTDHDSLHEWQRHAALRGWTMPRVLGWWRWWGVRHVRWWWCAYHVGLHHVAHSTAYGMPDTKAALYDRWVLFGIWHGLELKQDEPGGGE